jgi:hypothetical protein
MVFEEGDSRHDVLIESDVTSGGVKEVELVNEAAVISSQPEAMNTSPKSSINTHKNTLNGSTTTSTTSTSTTTSTTLNTFSAGDYSLILERSSLEESFGLSLLYVHIPPYQGAVCCDGYVRNQAYNPIGYACVEEEDEGDKEGEEGDTYKNATTTSTTTTTSTSTSTTTSTSTNTSKKKKKKKKNNKNKQNNNTHIQAKQEGKRKREQQASNRTRVGRDEQCEG